MKKILTTFVVLIFATSVIAKYSYSNKEKVTVILDITTNTDNPDKQEDQINDCRHILAARCERIGAQRFDFSVVKHDGRTTKMKLVLEGVNDLQRLEKLLTNSINLGFWESYNASEVMPYLDAADKALHTLLTNENKDKKNIEQEYPLLHFLQANRDSTYRTPVIGYTYYQDTAIINRYLAIPEIKSIFPQNLRFRWGASAADFDKDKNTVELFAIKLTTEGNETAPVGSDDIVDALSTTSDYHDLTCVNLAMNHAGTKRWATMTRENISRFIIIEMNGYVYSAPMVNSEITAGRAQIASGFSMSEGEDIAFMLKTGALPVPVKVISIKKNSKKEKNKK